MKRLVVVLVVVLLLPLAALPLLGISPLDLPQAMRVGTGLTAKLACSGHYLSGFSDQQNIDDIGTYSPATRAVSIRHAAPNIVEADIYGMAKASARYYPGLGCTLVYPGITGIDRLKVPFLTAPAGLWPQGEERGESNRAVQAALDALLAADTEAGLDSRALLVVRDGQIIAEAYKEGIGVNTPLLGWSMGKSVSAILLGRMEALGLLSVQETNLFAPWLGDERSEISLENLLQMSSGLDFDEPYVPGSDSTRMLFTEPSASDVALQSALVMEPGSHFYYSSGTSNMLPRLAWERLGGDSQVLLDFFAREIAQPLALGNTTMELDASGVFVGSSYIYAPARDWARLGLLMLDDGVASGKQLLPTGWVARASAPNSSDNDRRYGYQFWLNSGGEERRWPDLDPGAYAMMGNRGQVVMMLPGSNAIIVRLGWSASDYPTNDRFASVLQAFDLAK